MGYYKYINDGYVEGIGEATGDGNITKAEYNEILTIVHNRPTPKEGYGIRLKTDLTWEEYELPPEPEPEPTEEEDMQMALKALGVSNE